MDNESRNVDYKTYTVNTLNRSSYVIELIIELLYDKVTMPLRRSSDAINFQEPPRCKELSDDIQQLLFTAGELRRILTDMEYEIDNLKDKINESEDEQYI